MPVATVRFVVTEGSSEIRSTPSKSNAPGKAVRLSNRAPEICSRSRTTSTSRFVPLGHLPLIWILNDALRRRDGGLISHLE